MERSLSDIMEFDHVIKVDDDGTISEPRDVHVYADLNVNKDGNDEFDLSEGWTLLRGFTGQDSYSGPVMHSSEFIGGGLERHIRETPGYYVALVVEAYCDYDGSTDCDIEQGCSCEPAGWAIAYRPLNFGDGYCTKCGEPTDEFGPDSLCAYHRESVAEG